MLEPQSRAAFTELLKPPTGFELEYAVGTTFTLDLSTALMAPLSFASHRVTSSDEKLGVLEAVRRASDRIDIFAQAGQLSMGAPSDLVAFLEPMVHPVAIARGLFHPKVWVLKYRSGTQVTHRFLCGSRNLTNDRSWDAIICLDERRPEVEPTEDRFERNEPLVSFVRTLPGFAVHPLEETRRQRVLSLADGLSAIDWELPEGASSLTFHALGIGLDHISRPDFHGRRSLVVSPFVSEQGLAAMRSGVRERTHLLSRPETLDILAVDTFDDRLQTYVLDDAVSLEASNDGESTEVASDNGSDGPSLNRRAAAERLSGLHAKVVSVDRQYASHLFLGSVNATDAALWSNVEMMVELKGKTGTYGVEAILKALGDLKTEYETHGGAEPDPAEETSRTLDAALRNLAGVKVNIEVAEANPYDLRIWMERDGLERFANARSAGVELRWRLLTRADLGGERLDAGEGDAARVEGIDLVDITPFIVLSGSMTDPRGTQHERRTILLAQLHNDVPNRRDAIIAGKLEDAATFIRFLTLMLELSGVHIEPTGDQHALGFFGSAGGGVGSGGSGLFEALMRAVSSGHEGLAEAKRIIDFVQAQGDERAVLPSGFKDLWEQVWQAHLELRGAES
ncbi:MAG: phospholipase D family protein [Leucobacter sp.]|nr:phospholipase D family protein [Leucobacter sp.]